MKYTFSFKEVNYGSIQVESSSMPGKADIINAVIIGGAYYKDTEYEDIKFEEQEKATPKRERSYER
jgi:hypothetical protein